MKYENRHDPYRFFDELRKTPVVQVADKVYVVTGYRELLQLAHDPHVSSDISKSPISAQPAAHAQPDVGAEHMAGLRPGGEPDRVRPGQARQAAPTGDAALRAAALAGRHPQHGGRHPDAVQRLAGRGQGQGRQHLRRRRRLRLPGPGRGHLPDPRCPAEGRTHLPRLDLRLHGRRRHGPGRQDGGRSGPLGKGPESTEALTAVHGRPDPGLPDRTAGQRAVEAGERQRRPRRADDAQGSRGERVAAAHRRPRLDGQHHRALRADVAAPSRVDRIVARVARN